MRSAATTNFALCRISFHVSRYHSALKHVMPLLRIVVSAAPSAAKAWRKPYFTAVQPIVQVFNFMSTSSRPCRSKMPFFDILLQACIASVIAQARDGDRLRHECRIHHLPLWPVSGWLPLSPVLLLQRVSARRTQVIPMPQVIFQRLRRCSNPKALASLLVIFASACSQNKPF